jgi:hypothetical protein
MLFQEIFVFTLIINIHIILIIILLKSPPCFTLAILLLPAPLPNRCPARGKLHETSRHYDWSRWFVISSTPPICCLRVSVVMGGVAKSKITKLGCEK